MFFGEPSRLTTSARFVPSSCKQLPTVPVVHVGVPTTVMSRSKPDELAALLPLVSSSFQWPTNWDSTAIWVGHNLRLYTRKSRSAPCQYAVLPVRVPNDKTAAA